MLCSLIFFFKNIALACLLTTEAQATFHACRSAQEQKSCRTNSNVERARGQEFYQNSDPQDSFFTQLQQESLEKVEALQKDPGFQEIVKVLQNNSSHPQNTAVNSDIKIQGNPNEASLYIFVSFSLGEKALLNIAHEAKRFGSTLVLQGFREGSYLKTAQSLQNIIIKTGQGVLIDPELYSLFNITAVPTFVLAKPFSQSSQERTQTPLHDKLQGHVSTRYALESFAKEGDLKKDAQHLLHGGVTP